MTKYQLYNPLSGNSMKITIDESVKKDFKELMEWDEKQWNYHTKKLPTSNKRKTR